MPTAAKVADPVQILYADDGLAVAEIENIAISIWRRTPTVSRFEKQAAGVERVIARFPQSAAILCIVEQSCGPPDERLRRASVQMVAQHEQVLKCVACVAEGNGFRAAVTRSVLNGMALLKFRWGMPLTFFSSVDASVAWMSRHVSVPHLKSMVSHVEQVRSHILRSKSTIPL